MLTLNLSDISKSGKEIQIVILFIPVVVHIIINYNMHLLEQFYVIHYE